MAMKKGDRAVAHAVRQIQPDVLSAYPITPQTGIVQRLSQYAADGELAGEFLRVDSEFNACSSLIGASAAGARTFSATSSQGLKLMSEPLFTASGMRLPLVMVVANRSLSAPLSIWSDHTDAFAERDGGMIQFFAEDVQEAIDDVLMAYRVAEDPEISLPAIVNMDGYILTHVKEPADLLDKNEVEEYLPPRDPIYDLDPSDPKTVGAYARPEHWTETRYAVHDALERAKGTIRDVTESFAGQFGREHGLDHGGLVETYGADDADIALLALGSLNGTIRTVIEDHETPVKLVKPRVYRPFPGEELRDALSDVATVGVLTKEVSPGHGSSLATELKSELYDTGTRPSVRSYVIGLAGRDVPRSEIEEIIGELRDTVGIPPSHTTPEAREAWPQLREETLSQEVSSS